MKNLPCHKGDNCPYMHSKFLIGMSFELFLRSCVTTFLFNFKLFPIPTFFTDLNFKFLTTTTSDEYPCKYFHLRGFCYNDKECRFSHEALTDDTRQIIEMVCLNSIFRLLKHNLLVVDVLIQSKKLFYS